MYINIHVALLLTACGDDGVSDYEKGAVFIEAQDRPNAIKLFRKVAAQGYERGTILAGILLNYEGIKNFDQDKIKLGIYYMCKTLKSDIIESEKQDIRNIFRASNYTYD